MVKFRAKWQFKNTEVVIDELPFGFFLEIEGNEKEIFEVACLLNLDINKKISVKLKMTGLPPFRGHAPFLR